MSELPSGWATVPIGEICDLKNGRAFKTHEWEEEGLPIVRIQNLNNPDSKYNYFRGEAGERHRLFGGELLFAWSGTPGTSFGAHVWRGGDAVLNQHIYRIDFSEDTLHKRFLKFAINQKLNDLIDTAHGGVGLRHVTKKKFEATEILLPPYNEQKRIADKLDAVLARVDACREKLDRVPAILTKFRQSVLQAATTGELTKDWREEQGVIGANDSEGLPLGWETSTFGDMLQLIDGDRGKNYPKSSDYLIEGYCLYLSTKNVRPEGFLFENTVFINKSKHELLRSGTLQRNDVIVTTRGTIGNSAVYDDSVPYQVVRVNSGMLILRQNELRLIPHFLRFYINSPDFEIQMEEKRTGSAQPQLPAGVLRTFTLPVPPKAEQLEIVRRLLIYFQRLRNLEEAYQRGVANVENLPSHILAKAFRGELVPQDPADEPASVLLESLKNTAKAQPTKRPRSPGTPIAGSAL